jgi:hypothetical protein
MLQLWRKADCQTRLRLVVSWVAVLVLALLLCHGLDSCGVNLHSPISLHDNSSEDAVREEEAPSEFLFLDVDRVTSYLAQLKGGTFAKERLDHKIVKNAKGELSVEGLGNLGGSAEEEDFVEREVTPTAASNFIELEKTLEDDKKIGLEKNFLHHFASRVAPTEIGQEQEGKVQDGDFVSFEALIKGPGYMDPYLAVSHNAPISALLPQNARSPAGRHLLDRQRTAAKRFAAQIGKDPRGVLTVRATQKSTGSVVKFLMPIHLKQLSEERSLLRAGGVFTVVGKVVRVFTPPANAGVQGSEVPKFAYIDTPTRQTWRDALRGAPGELICRSNLACAGRIEAKGGMTGANRRKLIAETRAGMLRELARETNIEGDGALIVPVAIFR